MVMPRLSPVSKLLTGLETTLPNTLRSHW